MNKITTVGLDTAKSVFHAIGLNRAGKVVERKALRRGKVLGWFANLPATVVGIETCGASHYWGRELERLGHVVRLVPTRDVRALVRTQKNDLHDALAIAEAVKRPGQRFVAVKTTAEQDLQALHRLRRGAIIERTALSNRLRGLLAEYGLVMPKGLATLRRQLPEWLEDAEMPLSDTLREWLADALDHLRALDAQIARFDARVRRQVQSDPVAQRLLAVPGFGPVVASVWRARLGDGRQFRRGRDAAAAIGLVPRQDTTGGRPRLLGITKTGDRELRSLLIHGARSVLIHAHRKDDPLSRWACQVKARRGMHKATVALANKLARIAWAISVADTPFVPDRAA